MKNIVIAAMLLSASVAAGQSVLHCPVTVPLSFSVDNGGPPVVLPSELRVRVGSRDISGIKISKTPPGRFVLVLDASGSMANSQNRSYKVSEEQAWSAERELAEAAVNNVPAGTQVKYVTVGEDGTDSKFTSDGAAIIERIRKIERPRGTSAVFDSVMRALQSTDPPQRGDYVVVISDGADNRSKDSGEKLRKELIAKGVRLFAVISLLDRPITDEEYFGPVKLRQLARDTGGEYIQIDRVELARRPDDVRRTAITQALAQLHYVARNVYLLKLGDLAIEERDKVSIELRPAKKGLTLLYPKWVAPCSGN